MSGSSGSGGGGDFTPDRQDCSQLVLETQLSSPKPTVVAGLQVDQVLAVDVRSMNGANVVVVLAGREVAGGLASPGVQRLRECIEQGHRFQAIVRQINQGQVRVRVQAA
jgi:hypothetical protein